MFRNEMRLGDSDVVKWFLATPELDKGGKASDILCDFHSQFFLVALKF